MKVALVHPSYRPDGGAEKAISLTFNALRHKGASIRVISRSWSKNAFDLEVVQCNPFYLGRLWREWSFARKAGRMLENMQDVDVIQSQVRLPGCDIYRAGGGVHREWLRQRNRISGPVRKVLTKLSPFHTYKRYTESRLYADSRLKAVICNSRMVGWEIAYYFNLSWDKIHVIYNSVDLQSFDRKNCLDERNKVRNRLNIKEDQTAFLFVGSGFERKGLSILLECLSYLPRDCLLLVVGKDKQIEGYITKSNRLGISERVKFLGIQEHVRPFYAAADAFVLPTLYDAFANTVLEAMASSLPVITSLKCGAVDLIETEKNGYICDALDKDKIVEYMDKLRNQGVRKEIGTAGRESVEGFTIENMSNSLYALYEKILD